MSPSSSGTNIEAILATAADLQRMFGEGINPDGSLKSEAIRALLKFKGVNLKGLAKTNGYSDPYFHQIINREYKDRVVEDIIAEALGLTSDRIWGR